MATPTNFRKFSELPNEIGDIVWDIYLEANKTPRVIEVLRKEKNRGRYYTDIQTPSPLLHVNSKARARALMHYQRLEVFKEAKVIDNKSQSQSEDASKSVSERGSNLNTTDATSELSEEPPTVLFGTFIAYEIDTIYLSCYRKGSQQGDCPCTKHLLYHEHFLGLLKNSAAARENIQRICLSGRWLATSTILKAMQSLPNLTSLMIAYGDRDCRESSGSEHRRAHRLLPLADYETLKAEKYQGQIVESNATNKYVLRSKHVDENGRVTVLAPITNSLARALGLELSWSQLRDEFFGKCQELQNHEVGTNIKLELGVLVRRSKPVPYNADWEEKFARKWIEMDEKRTPYSELALQKIVEERKTRGKGVSNGKWQERIQNGPNLRSTQQNLQNWEDDFESEWNKKLKLDETKVKKALQKWDDYRFDFRRPKDEQELLTDRRFWR